ncbi:MAG TPA: hypothetical protein VE974_08730 [Thermoanaerobaculia bacterium]|nr:hypothetical protein [Thermoanaerobaculia bacterium]
MRRNTMLLAVLVSLFSITEAFAVCRTETTWTRDVSTLKLGGSGKPDANGNLFDYGVIFEDANTTTCAGPAAVALYKKVKATLAFPNYADGSINWQAGTTVGPYGGWLEGANLGLVYAAALRLGANGQLTKPLVTLIDSINYPGNIDAYCGFGTNRAGQPNIWTVQNSCMDDWAMVAHARGWQAAWKTRTVGFPNVWAAQTNAAIAGALNITESICSHRQGDPLPNPAPATGPCTGSIADLDTGAATPVALHNGDAMPYGIGLMTGIASAVVGMESTGVVKTFSSDEVKVAKALFRNSDFHTEWDPTYQYSFNDDCYSFSLVNGGLARGNTFGCWEPGYGNGRDNGYQPEMFPVKDFYAWKIGVPSTSNFDFSYFQDSLFCDDPTDPDCLFFGPGRKAVYKTLSRDWVNTGRPALSVATVDYTSTFKAYDNAHYLSARNGGGSDVNAEPTTIGNNERFSMLDVNGGTLMTGDYVYLQVANGNYVGATNGGGSTVVATANTPITWERFTIQKMNGTGQIFTGDKVALKVLNNQYISAVNGGGSSTTAQYSPASTWETFTLNFTR